MKTPTTFDEIFDILIERQDEDGCAKLNAAEFRKLFIFLQDTRAALENSAPLSPRSIAYRDKEQLPVNEAD